MNTAESFRQWLQEFPEGPRERLSCALAAVDAFEVCEQRGHVTEEGLTAIVSAASSPHKLTFETGCRLLACLAVRNAEAQQALLQMARGKSVAARLHAVAYLAPELPQPLRREIVERALEDSSAKVRGKGVEMAEQFQLTQFLPQLKVM